MNSAAGEIHQAIITNSRRYKCKFTSPLSCQTPAIKPGLAEGGWMGGDRALPWRQVLAGRD